MFLICDWRRMPFTTLIILNMSYSKGQGWNIALSLYFEIAVTLLLKHMD